jgi:molybdenum cofactor synthesis domain-containing protein
MQEIRVEEAVGTVLMHDITRIVPGEFKGRAFAKGHVIRSEDIPELLKLGKDHVFVGKIQNGKVHEHEAALRIAKAIAGDGLTFGEPSEGKVTLRAAFDGMCYIDEESLLEINMIDEMAVATRNHKKPVKKGDAVAALKVIPLAVDEDKLELVERIVTEDVIRVNPFRSFKVGVVTTGNEVFTGRIEDKFGPVIQKKIKEYGCEMLEQMVVPDDATQITLAINDLIKKGAEIIFTTGGMSVDPDDVTPMGIKATGAEIVSYGAPVFPGAMLLVAYLGDIPILGLPGAVSYFKATIFDLIMPLILSEQRIEKRDLAKLGMGGLCLNCKVCHYPVCTFGTGA